VRTRVFGHIVQRTTAGKDRNRPRDDAIRLDCMVIYNDWPTSLECSTVFGYIKDYGSRDETECMIECVTECVIS